VERPKIGQSTTAYGESLSNKFRTLMARKLGEYTDVRFAAHGSPWYPQSRLDAIVTLNKAEVRYIHFVVGEERKPLVLPNRFLLCVDLI
jgi:hypothetical protein